MPTSLDCRQEDEENIFWFHWNIVGTLQSAAIFDGLL
jgi:hypothetical protein